MIPHRSKRSRLTPLELQNLPVLSIITVNSHVIDASGRSIDYVSGPRRGRLELVSRVDNELRRHERAVRVSPDVPVYLAAVLAYPTSEIRELAGNAAHDVDMTRVLPTHIHLGACNNDLRRLIIRNLVIAKAGALPNTQDALQPTMAH
ncbi:unnamed protein product [Mesocestoides corti]|uniref:Histone H2A n=1 Tax=Mesocestoides corti TaxID=53468 RepID=A0A0R3UNC4_MESCO|nr:unnamed protein product [Mesocestoides corti]